MQTFTMQTFTRLNEELVPYSINKACVDGHNIQSQIFRHLPHSLFNI